MSRRWPARLASFMVDTTQPTTRPRYIVKYPLSGIQADGIDDADDGRIDRRIFAALRHAGRAAGDGEHGLAEPGADGIHRNHVAGLVLAIGADRFQDQQRLAFEARVLPGG